MTYGFPVLSIEGDTIFFQVQGSARLAQVDVADGTLNSLCRGGSTERNVGLVIKMMRFAPQKWRAHLDLVWGGTILEGAFRNQRRSVEVRGQLAGGFLK